MNVANVFDIQEHYTLSKEPSPVNENVFLQNLYKKKTDEKKAPYQLFQ